MEAWWYVEGVTKFGPVDEEALKQALLAGKISSQTMVWHTGMPQWQIIAQTPELGYLIPPTSPRQKMAPAPVVAPVRQTTSTVTAPHPTESYAAAYAGPYTAPNAECTEEEYLENRETLNLATVNQRTEARLVDYTIAAFIGYECLSLIYRVFPIPLLNVEIILFAVICFFSFVIDALIYGIFGNTLGKYLLGIQIRTINSDKPDFTHYLIRNLKTWVFAFACGISFLSFFTLLFQVNRLNKMKATTYDAASGDCVYSIEVTPSMKLVGHLLFSLVALYQVWTLLKFFVK